MIACYNIAQYCENGMGKMKKNKEKKNNIPDDIPIIWVHII